MNTLILFSFHFFSLETITWYHIQTLLFVRVVHAILNDNIISDFFLTLLEYNIHIISGLHITHWALITGVVIIGILYVRL
jgi:hypothetical protein